MHVTPDDTGPLAFYQTSPHRCSYLPDRQAAMLFADPEAPKNPGVQRLLAEQGFRRSGGQLYRPRCPACTACIPVRLAVDRFQPNRAQRRTLKHNQDLTIRLTEACATDEYVALYGLYLQSRHGDNTTEPQAEAFLDFLVAEWSDTFFLEFRLNTVLVAIAVVDRWADALSAVFTFFDPSLTQRSLGRFAVLTEIDTARTMGLTWLHLGYWIEDCRKMRYKQEYQPLQYLVDGQWRQATAE